MATKTTIIATATAALALVALAVLDFATASSNDVRTADVRLPTSRDNRQPGDEKHPPYKGFSSLEQGKTNVRRQPNEAIAIAETSFSK
ncbi:MAG: hypothetical protein V7774_08050 [Pseudorhizobium pelagicum]|uniref:hypothetical protein n=1 Tax=Pseudorhizobium pelagicum TaxID=1509405 RepID=UPI003460DF64